MNRIHDYKTVQRCTRTDSSVNTITFDTLATILITLFCNKYSPFNRKEGLSFSVLIIISNKITKSVTECDLEESYAEVSRLTVQNVKRTARVLKHGCI